MKSEFNALGFDKYIFAKNKESLADSFYRNNRCGIYILHFGNGDFYVGQAVDVVKRHHQHRKNHKDIEFISFRKVSKLNLNKFEKDIIYALELQNKPLRNISLASIIKGETDLDLIVSREDQQKWINYQLPKSSLETPRFDYTDLRRKYTNKFNKLKSSLDFEEICEILQNYILYTIPYPSKTAYSFWSCSCLPKSPNVKILSRVNIFWQESLCIYEQEYNYREKGEDCKAILHIVSVFLCKSSLLEKTSKANLKKKFSSLIFTDSFYETGGQDQLNIQIDSFEFLDFLYYKPVSDAIKEFNLRLMRKGGCNNNRYHCFDLADEVLRTDNIDFE